MDKTVTHLAEYLERSAARAPDRPAVVNPGGSAISYGELNERAEHLAARLRAGGVVPGDRVGILLPKSIDSVVAIFAILKADAAYVPVDATAPRERIHTILHDCQVRSVVSNNAGADLFAADPEPRLQMLLLGEHSLSPERAGDPPYARRSEGLAYILYTSGSTGVPKGVMLSHANAISFIEWCSDTFTPDGNDRFSSHAPFHFDLSVFDLFVAIKHGATVFLISEEVSKSPQQLARFVAEQRLTICYATPSVLAMLVEFGGLNRLDFSALRLVLFAGEVFPVKHLRRLLELWPRPAYFNLYGPTETNVCTFWRIPPAIPPDRTTPYPIGLPCTHCDTVVLNDALAPVQPGEEGLLYVAGPAVFQGYWNRPEQTRAVLIERAGRRWYNTGDVVREDNDGSLLYLGRRDRMVKRRGYRVELGEIESALYRHPEIREVATTAQADANAGIKIVAHVVPRSGAKPTIISLKQFCAQQLPAYMVPDVFAFRDALPHTSTDKIDYQTLARALGAPGA
ncbi:MAG: amino acid adenylation domain-containing protein [Deltaproteobacteria bacterium]|nr:amino acid adenylation domain-containing protein [Deltaproteobacteria bacterium]